MTRQLLFIVLFVITCSFQSTKFNKTKINDEISLLLPEDFTPIPADQMASQFISYRSPLAAYTDMTTDIAFGINKATSFWRDSDVELMRSFYRTNIINLYDKVEFLRDEVETINKRKFVVFEYIGTLYPESKSLLLDPPVIKYTYVQYSIIHGQVYLFDFSSPSDQRDTWKPIIQKVMESVKIK